jgi:hypothetical protein
LEAKPQPASSLSASGGLRSIFAMQPNVAMCRKLSAQPGAMFARFTDPPNFSAPHTHHCEPGELWMNVTTALPVRKGCNERVSARQPKSICIKQRSDAHESIFQCR